MRVGFLWIVCAALALPGCVVRDSGGADDGTADDGTSDGAGSDGGSSDGGGSGNGSSTSSDSSDLVFFEGSGCKGEPGEIYAGLNCIAWDTTDPEVTKFDLFNFVEACGLGPESWQGEAFVEPDGTVELWALNPECEGGDGCPDCPYDAVFGVANVPTNDELALRLFFGNRICDGVWQDEPPVAEISLPVGSEPIGAVCRYGEDHLGMCGTAFMGCRPCYDGDSVEPCDEGLECAATEEGNEEDPVCHPTCEVDEDCPWDGVLSCQDGLCRPANPW
jgi:hypothetical protein